MSNVYASGPLKSLNIAKKNVRTNTGANHSASYFFFSKTKKPIAARHKPDTPHSNNHNRPILCVLSIITSHTRIYNNIFFYYTYQVLLLVVSYYTHCTQTEIKTKNKESQTLYETLVSISIYYVLLYETLVSISIRLKM